MLAPQRGQPLQFSLSQSLLKDSSTARWITRFPKRCSMNLFPSALADMYSSLRPRSSSEGGEERERGRERDRDREGGRKGQNERDGETETEREGDRDRERE